MLNVTAADANNGIQRTRSASLRVPLMPNVSPLLVLTIVGGSSICASPIVNNEPQPHRLVGWQSLILHGGCSWR